MIARMHYGSRTCRTLPLLLALATLPTACDPLLETGDAIVADTSATPTLTSLYDRYLYQCGDCHAPEANGRTADIEATLDFTNVRTARATLAGYASGMVGNQADCNGIAFLGPTYQTSLLAAVLDFDVRTSFDSETGCDGDTISDMTLKVGRVPPAGFLNDLASWIDGGAR